MTKKNKSILGKVYYQFYPEYIFGNLIFHYWKFKVLQIFRKSAKVQTIEQYGLIHSGLVPIERLNKYFFTSERQGIKWNKTLISNTIKNLKKELEENESRIKIVYYFNEYDKAYQNTPKSESRYYEYIDTYFMFLDYMNKTKRKGLK